MNKIAQLTTLALAALSMAACSHIDEDERLIYVKMEAPKRTVLLEDFTGQRCVNCPTATDIIGQLLKQVGDSALIPVAIHCGPLGFAGNATTIGLATDTGDEYYKHWKLEFQPVGLVDRRGPMNYTIWTMEAMADMSQNATVDLKVTATRQDNTISIDTKATGINNVSGKLQLWVLEDNITALQMMPDGKPNANYVHNHVFRKAVNGTWGEDISLAEGETKTVSARQDIDATWNPAQLSIVAFVYNDSGVQQAAKAKVK